VKAFGLRLTGYVVQVWNIKTYMQGFCDGIMSTSETKDKLMECMWRVE